MFIFGSSGFQFSAKIWLLQSLAFAMIFTSDYFYSSTLNIPYKSPFFDEYLSLDQTWMILNWGGIDAPESAIFVCYALHK